MALSKKQFTQVIREWYGIMLDAGKLMMVLGTIVKKADDDGLLDKLDQFKFELTQGDSKLIETDKKDPPDRKACEHDHEGSPSFNSLGHGFSKCCICGAIRQDEQKPEVQGQGKD